MSARPHPKVPGTWRIEDISYLDELNQESNLLQGDGMRLQNEDVHQPAHRGDD
jgi:hypothetical protein